MSPGIQKIVDKLFLLLASIFITLGAMGANKDISIPFSIVIGTSYLGTTIFLKHKLEVPGNFKLYLVSLVLLLFHTIIFHGKIAYFWLFLSSGLYWISFLNVKKVATEYFYHFIVLLGILMALVWILLKSIGLNSFSPDNLFLPLGAITVHNHLGDLWAVIMVISLGRFLKKSDKRNLLLTIIGAIIVMFSYSRSAVLSVVVGSIFIYYKNYRFPKIKRYLYLVIILSIGIMLYFSLTKSILFSRPYFTEAIISIINSPLGIGMGNFAKVSPETNNVHNLILEFAVGMGVFSFTFIYWLFVILKQIFQLNRENIIYPALILTILTNFLFDSTYVIPAMIWIWFIALALV